MLVYEGQDLEQYKRDNLGIEDYWNERNFVKYVSNYSKLKTEKVLAVGGLRGTGKTVGILQALPSDDTCYILCQKDEPSIGADYIQSLKHSDKKNIIIDEYTWIKDRRPLER